MKNSITYIGLDAHKAFINVAMLLPGKRQVVEWKVENEPKAVRRMVRRWLKAGPAEVRCCYEAGPCGYALKRQIEEIGPVVCEVIAPSLIPRLAGDRVKTDRKDARKLAEMLRADLLTSVSVPDELDESVRDLCRCREDAKADLRRAQQRLGKFLLRRGRIYNNGRAWTGRHMKWLREQTWDLVADRTVFGDYLQAVEQIEDRIEGIDEAIFTASQSERYVEAVGQLRCFRGIDTTTAMSVVAELHDFRRFHKPRQLMSYLGLTPSEYSSGGKSRRGGITKTGNGHVRRLLIESAWHYRHRPRVGVALRKRRAGQPAAAISIADKAQIRLHKRYWRLTEGRGMPSTKAVVAVARELAGFIWSLLHPQAHAEVC